MNFDIKNDQVLEVPLLPNDQQRLINFCGTANENLNLIEAFFDIKIYMRGNMIRLLGQSEKIKKVQSILLELYEQTQAQTLTPEFIKKNLQTLSETTRFDQDLDTSPALLNRIQGLTQNQKKYIENIKNYPINFVVGPAGSGKTYIAVTYGIEALMERKFKQLVIVRPAVEAGERLGFLPGQLNEKIDPYLRPIYDVMNEAMDKKTVAKLIKKELIQTIPLAFMRGRTIKNAFVILDEAQNTTPAQMKMFLTRFGQNAKMIITGDMTQNDLPVQEKSGLCDAIDRLKGIDQIAINYLNTEDIVRHWLIKNILKHY